MPTLERFQPRPVGDKPWGIELLIAHTQLYVGKILYMNAGHCGGLQYHVEKDETFHLFSGSAMVSSSSSAAAISGSDANAMAAAAAATVDGDGDDAASPVRRTVPSGSMLEARRFRGDDERCGGSEEATATASDDVDGPTPLFAPGRFALPPMVSL